MVPIELWDLELDDGILWDHMDGDALPGALVEAVTRLRRGTARTRSGTRIPPLAREVEALWLAGGRNCANCAIQLNNVLSLPAWISDGPVTFAERGARALVPDASTLAVIDLGQSRLKLSLGSRRFEHERPWARLPLRDGPAPIDPTEARATLREWVSTALAHATTSTALRPDAVVLALPCELPDAPIPGSSSYPGLQDDAAFVPDVLSRAGWHPERTLVLNDAELAAVAAGLDPRTHGTLTLVLTLGFGVGGALRLP